MNFANQSLTTENTEGTEKSNTFPELYFLRALRVLRGE
jgi:hypothetical protein